MKKLKDQTNKVAHWLLKRLVFYLDRNDELIAYTFGRDERTDYSVIAERFHDDFYTVGTVRYSYPEHNMLNEDSVCHKCKFCCVLFQAESETRGSPAIPADLDCELGCYENFGTKYGCYSWKEKEE